MENGNETVAPNGDLQKFISKFHQPDLGYDGVFKEFEQDGIADLYEEAVATDSYIGHRYCADMLAAVMDNREAVVLDAAAGTGLVGKSLQKRSFRNLHAHDGSQALVDACVESGVYTKSFCCYLGEGLGLPVADNAYDAVTMSGGTIVNHIHPVVQAEFIRVIKPGGYFVNTYRAYTPPGSEYLQAWQGEAEKLAKEGKWRFYGRLRFPKFNCVSDGFTDIYQVLEKS